MPKTKVNSDTIEKFLNGSNPKKYVVAVEAVYSEPSVYLVVNDPEKGKIIEKHDYKPFLWYKEEVRQRLFDGNTIKSIEAAQKYGVTSKRLRVNDENGYIPDRLENGYRYIATCTKSYNNLISFFREGGIDVFDKDTSKLFFMFTPVEQFMIQTGIRLFKGMDDYNDLHRLQFDLETEGLDGKRNAIFQIGFKDNRGNEHVLEVKGNTPQEKRDSERDMICKFFKVVDYLKPDIIAGYNSEAFDFPFIVDRAERLGVNLSEHAIGLDGISIMKRKPSILKLGNETEPFEQTYLFGHNIIDISHSVRRAQAINSDIKGWGLKYITQYSKIAKKNRVYIPGDKIHTIWSDKISKYAFNNVNGDWYVVSDKMPLTDGYEIVGGDYLIQRYLLDDLWETEQIDNIFNQAAFLISKILPTTFSRSSTMGTATQWKLIMAAWSYENKLAIPETESKRDFTGGLSRLLKVGYSKNVSKMDYAALYPKCQLTNGIFPNLDISGVMEGLLTYVVDTRDKFKFLTGEYKDLCKEISKQIEDGKDILSKEKLEELEDELKKNKALQNLYDKKQLPLKILANSWFGAYGAPYIFNWGDSDCAEETTCRSRQYLRLMVKYFKEKHGFDPLILDTDGVNFAYPKSIDDFRYVAQGTHWKTEKDAGKELAGLDAALAEFNENYMLGRMGLDIDDIYNSTINFSRKNYANDLNGKIKFVGNSIKSKKMPVYIEDFLSKAIRLLLDGKGKEFITYYHEYVDKIYNYNIPLVKIASKSKVKSTLSDYKKKSGKKNKAGNPMPRQAHMELAINANLNVNMGDTLYYVNTGKVKSHPDVKAVKKEDGSVEIQLNCRLINPEIVENSLEMIKDMESLKKMLLTETNEEKILDLKTRIDEMEVKLETDEYNVAKYLEAFNKKVKPLLVCFHPDIRGKILLSIKKDKKTKLEKLDDRNIYTELECELVSGMPTNPEDQDTYEELMTMEDKEIKFWNKVNKIPNNIEEAEWLEIEMDYLRRKEIERLDGIKSETDTLKDIFKRLEYSDLKKIEKTNTLPTEILIIATIDSDYNFISRKWGVLLCPAIDMFNYEEDAIERSKWYQLSGITGDDKFEKWLEYKEKESVEFETNIIDDKYHESITNIQKNISESEEKIIDVVAEKENDDDEDDDDKEIIEEDDFKPELQKIDFQIETTRTTTFAKKPVIAEVMNKPKNTEILPEKVKPKEEDEWNF